MTLKQILSMTWWPTVALALVKAYPEDRKSLAGFRSVYDKLMDMEPVANSGLTIVIESVEYKHDRGHFWYDVYGILPDKDDSLALEFRPWREWLGMSVAKGTINFLTPSQIAAHCLHEMTYFGFEEQEVQSIWNDIERDADEVRSGTAELEELDIDALSSPRDIKEMLRWLGRYVCFSSVSKKYFGQDARWFKQRFTDKDSPFSPDEIDLVTLKGALRDIALEIIHIADEL